MQHKILALSSVRILLHPAPPPPLFEYARRVHVVEGKVRETLSNIQHNLRSPHLRVSEFFLLNPLPHSHPSHFDRPPPPHPLLFLISNA